jgi:hypothetical protein
MVKPVSQTLQDTQAKKLHVKFDTTLDAATKNNLLENVKQKLRAKYGISNEAQITIFGLASELGADKNSKNKEEKTFYILVRKENGGTPLYCYHSLTGEVGLFGREDVKNAILDAVSGIDPNLGKSHNWFDKFFEAIANMGTGKAPDIVLVASEKP